MAPLVAQLAPYAAAAAEGAPQPPEALELIRRISEAVSSRCYAQARAISPDLLAFPHVP